MEPGGGSTFFVQGGLHVHAGIGMVEVELDIVLTAEDDLHRLADGL